MTIHYSYCICIIFSTDIEGASGDDKDDFLGEAYLLSKFNHPNVLTLLGVVTIDEPVLVITPFMKNGDLRTFLARWIDVANMENFKNLM